MSRRSPMRGSSACSSLSLPLKRGGDQRLESVGRSWPRSWRGSPTKRLRSRWVVATRSRSPLSPAASPRSRRDCGTPALPPATASLCSRPILPTSSRPRTPAGRSAPSRSSSTVASAQGLAARTAERRAAVVGRDAQDARRRPCPALGTRCPAARAREPGRRQRQALDVVERHAPGADALAAVVFTSGATGPAKGVLYDQQMMAAQYTAVRECYSIGADDRLVAAFAPFALYGRRSGSRSPCRTATSRSRPH